MLPVSHSPAKMAVAWTLILTLAADRAALRCAARAVYQSQHQDRLFRTRVQ